MTQTIDSQIDHVLGWKPLEDLAVLYSPNHSDTTEQHVRKQVEMVRALAQNNYDTLLDLTGSHAVEPIRVSRDGLADFFNGLTKGYTSQDYKILASLAAVHDCGKEAVPDSQLSRLQASANIPMSDHIAASEAVLRAHPKLLDHFGLSETEGELVKVLTGKHTDTGRYFFGEAHLAVFEIGRAHV